MSREHLQYAPVDFANRLSLESEESDLDDSSNTSSPCKSIRANHYSRKSSIQPLDVKNKVSALNSYSFSHALEHANRDAQRKQRLPSLSSLLDLKQPSISLDDMYSPLQSPADSVCSLASFTSCGTPTSITNSELDSDLGTELETDIEGDKEGDTTDADILTPSSKVEHVLRSSEAEEHVYDDDNGDNNDNNTDDEAFDTPLARPLSRTYPIGHRANRSVLGISFSQHQKMVVGISGSADAVPEYNFDAGGSKARSATNQCKPRTGFFHRGPWLPPTKVRRTQSMFATPEQMMHEQQLGNLDRKPACQASAHGISFLDSPECPIPTFTVRQDPFPRITHETLCRLIDGEFREIYPEVLVIDCRFEYEYEGGHIQGAINVNSKQQLEQALFNDDAFHPSSTKRLLIFHCEYSAYRSPLLASHLRYCDRSINASRYPNLCYPDVLVLDGGYSEFYNAASHRCVPQNYIGMNHQAHQSTCQREMSRFRNGMKARKFQSFAMASSPQLSDFRFPESSAALRSASVTNLPTPNSSLLHGGTPSSRKDNVFGP